MMNILDEIRQLISFSGIDDEAMRLVMDIINAVEAEHSGEVKVN